MIRCPACQTENKPSTRFCRECGASLPAAAPEPEDTDATILIPPAESSSKREPTTTIELAVKRIAPAPEQPKSPASDDDMTVVLPRKSPPKPKYEPAPPTITGPLTEPPKRTRHATPNGTVGGATAGAAARKSMTPILVLALLAIAGGSAGYLGWLMLKKHKAGSETEQVAAVTPAPAAQPAPPAAATTPASTPAQPAPAPQTPVPTATVGPSTPPPAQSEVTPAQPAASSQQPPAQSAASGTRPDESLSTAEKRQLEKAKADAAKKEKLEKQKKAASVTPVAASSEPAPPPARPDTHRPAVPAPEPAPRPETSPVASLREELRVCEAQNVFKREFCKHQARQRHCAGLWDQVPECPSKKDEKLY